ncbi:hypothetical protein L6452_16945 [Arctium lappa]|uniref:Uncharacterized protein n=1 Tax=Arctium lappa TaxID=4217 RepID=A0ACB9C1X3_ARCLA|nr:hypothetical protein L6452_16945 [Arctium lappa]
MWENTNLCYLILVLPSYTCSAELLEEKKKLAPFVQVLPIFDGTKDMVVQQLTAAIDGTRTWLYNSLLLQ